jgi:hypothetical protein
MELVTVPLGRFETNYIKELLDGNLWRKQIKIDPGHVLVVMSLTKNDRGLLR